MRQAAGPHYGGAELIVGRICHQLFACYAYIPYQTFAQGICNAHRAVCGKIALHAVHHYIRNAAGRLICRERHSPFRIHYSETGAAEIAVAAAFLAFFGIGEDAAVAHLAAAGGNGEDHPYWQCRLRLCFAVEEIPQVAVVPHPIGDSFGGIDYAASSHRKDEIHSLPEAEIHPLQDKVQMGIGHHAAKKRIRQAGCIQHIFYLGDKAAAHCTSSAVMDEHLGSAIFFQKGDYLFFAFTAEDNLGRCIVNEIAHNTQI